MCEIVAAAALATQTGLATPVHVDKSNRENFLRLAMISKIFSRTRKSPAREANFSFPESRLDFRARENLQVLPGSERIRKTRSKDRFDGDDGAKIFVSKIEADAPLANQTGFTIPVLVDKSNTGELQVRWWAGLVVCMILCVRANAGDSRDCDTGFAPEAYTTQVMEVIYRNGRFASDGVAGDPSTVLEIRTDGQGNVLAAETVRSSGNDRFDASTRRAVMISSPLPLDASGASPRVFLVTWWMFAKKDRECKNSGTNAR